MAERQAVQWASPAGRSPPAPGHSPHARDARYSAPWHSSGHGGVPARTGRRTCISSAMGSASALSRHWACLSSSATSYCPFQLKPMPLPCIICAVSPSQPIGDQSAPASAMLRYRISADRRAQFLQTGDGSANFLRDSRIQGSATENLRP